MKLTAIDSRTGRIVMSHDGSMSEQGFLQTISSAFPDIPPDDVVIVRDGEIMGKQAIGHRPLISSKRSIVYKGSFLDLGGYANLNREISMRLLQRGFAVKLDVLKTAPQVDPATMSIINALSSIKLDNEKSCPIIVGFTPMPVQGRGRRVIFFTMMETQGLHHEFADRCNKFSTEIWVPCKFYLDVFKKAGICKPMHLIPLGVNEKIYVPGAKEPFAKYEEMPSGKIVEKLPNKFRFISLFGYSYRKGPDALCRSFLREFDASEDVCLVIYSRYMGGSGEPQKEYVRNEIRNYYKEISGKNPPAIYYCGDPFEINALPGIYAAADCFVFCSRGEGFGLPVCEAGACGIPVISTYNTAMTEYLDHEVAYLVESDEYATANDKLTWITEYYQDQLFPVLGDKAIAEFSRHMRHVFTRPEEAEIKAANFRDRILKEYTWDHAADRVARRLSAI